jgi:hypothetical protein
VAGFEVITEGERSTDSETNTRASLFPLRITKTEVEDAKMYLNPNLQPEGYTANFVIDLD